MKHGLKYGNSGKQSDKLKEGEREMKGTDVVQTDKPERFKNRREALAWLQKRGQISRGKFYDDCAAGTVTIYPDKTVSKFDVALYAEKLFTSSRNSSDSGNMSQERERLEIEKLRFDVSKRELETRREDDKWLLKEDAWARIAALVGVLQEALRYQFHTAAVNIVHIAGGDHARVMEVYELCEDTISRAYNQVAESGRISVVFEKTGDQFE
jgi:hypothetical protein